MRRRLRDALGLSLAFHALLFGLLLRLSERQLPPPSQRPLLVEVVQLPASRASRPGGTRPSAGGPAEASRRRPLEASLVPRTPGAGRPDAPRVAPNLFPHGALAVASPEARTPETLDAGSPAEVLTARVQGWRLGALAEQRVATGVDSYFSTLAHALRDGLGEAPPPGAARQGTPSSGQKWLKGWLTALEEAEGPEDAPSTEERGPQQPQHDQDGREGDMLRRLLGPMAPTQTSLTGPFQLFRKTQLPPAAVLRLTQDVEGHLVRTELLASSGDATFDEWVRRSAPVALASVPKPPAYGAGLHQDGTRSEWAFYRSGDGVTVLLLRVY